MSNSLKLILQSIKHILSRKAEFPNWNENDPKSPSHIRGRFGGYMKRVEKVVLEETTFTTTEQNGLFVAEVACFPDLSVFPNILVFNGTEYDVPDSFMTNGIIGTVGTDGPDFSDYPFLISFIDACCIVYTPNASTNTFSLLYRGEEPVVIDKKFLPPYPVIPEIPKVNIASKTVAGIVKVGANLTVSSDGTVSAPAPTEAFTGDIQKENYILRMGEPKYSGYGFAVIYKNPSLGTETVQTIYGPGTIYDESSGSHLAMSSQSVFRASNTDNKKIVISVLDESASGECSICLYRKDGESFSVDANGYFSFPDNLMQIGSVNTSNVFDEYRTIIRGVKNPELRIDVATKGYVDDLLASLLPNPTTADNGKILGVVDGKWALVDK